MLDFFENDYATYKLLNEGILSVRYHNDISIDFKAAVQTVKDRLLIQQGERLAVLCDIRGVKEINKSAREYLAVEGSVLIKAVAFIVESPVSEVLSSFYLRTNNPPIPNRSFQSIEKAKSFLNSF